MSFGKISGYISKEKIIKEKDVSCYQFESIIDFDLYFGETLEIMYLPDNMVSFSFNGVEFLVPKSRIKTFHRETGDDYE